MVGQGDMAASQRGSVVKEGAGLTLAMVGTWTLS